MQIANLCSNAFFSPSEPSFFVKSFHERFIEKARFFRIINIWEKFIHYFYINASIVFFPCFRCKKSLFSVKSIMYTNLSFTVLDVVQNGWNTSRWGLFGLRWYRRDTISLSWLKGQPILDVRSWRKLDFFYVKTLPK